jgi:hypothetical protein
MERGGGEEFVYEWNLGGEDYRDDVKGMMWGSECSMTWER